MKGTGVIMKNKSIPLDQPLIQVISEETVTKLVNMKYKKYLETEYWSLVRNAMHEFTGFLRVPGYPSMIVIDEKGSVKKTIVGYKTPEQLRADI